ncbi:unnamed protein product, partial [Rotaria sp. Silwood2]
CIIVPISFNTPTRLSRDDIYTALRTIDLEGSAENIHETPFLSTPIKQQPFPSIPYATPLISYLSPSIPYTSPSIAYASPSLNTSLQTPTHDRSASGINTLHNKSNLIPACLPTPNPSSPNFAARFCADVVQLVETGNKHKHSDTCYKYSNPKQGDKKSCRLRMPRKLVPVSTIDPDTGHISMRRSDPWINNFNEYLIAACRSNMDIKFIWSGSDAKALVYYITDYVTKMSLSFHDTFSLIQKSIASLKNLWHETDKESAIEKSRKLVLRCYNTLASQQELSGVQVASHLMNWGDHYTTHRFQGLFLIQTEKALQTQLNEMRAKRKLELEARAEAGKSIKEKFNQKGRSPNERYPFQKQHPQATTYLMMKYSQPHVPILYGPQIPRRDREDTRERYSRALLTLFVPWRTVADLCDMNQTWEDAFKSRQHLISVHSRMVIENIQLLHECKKDRDDHLLQVIAEAQTENDTIDPIILPVNQDVHGEYDADDTDDLLELLGSLDERTTAIATASAKSTENKYIEETIEAVEKVGRFTDINAHDQSSFNGIIDHIDQPLAPFISATPVLIRLNTKWQEQLKSEKERIRRSLITGNYDNDWDGTVNLDAAKCAVVTVVNSNNYNMNKLEKYGSILPVISVTTNFPTQKNIVDEFTLNREQRAAFMIITSHLDGDSRCRTGNFHKTSIHISKYTIFSGDNNGQLIMCVPGCGGTGKSQLICALTKYFLITKRMPMMRKLAPTGIAAAEIDGMTIHSFLGERRNSGKARTIKPGDSKLEKEWALVEYLLIDEMSMVGLTLLAKLNRIICAAKHADPQVPFGGINVIFFGDYLQYRPVYDAPLHTDFSLSPRTKSGKAPSENQIQQRVARSLILQINCVVKLTQQMRTQDLRYLQLLERLRHGQCNYDDYELLLTRVAGQPSVGSLCDPPWNKAPILVFRNEVRTQLNQKAAIHKAVQLGYAPMVCVAQDTCKGKQIEDQTLIKKLLELSDSKTEHLPGLLPLIPGMPVILTQNIAIELGLINGTNGIFRQFVYQVDSVSTNIISEAFPNNTQYVHRPLYALVEIARSKVKCNLDQLQPKLIPIPVMEQTFRIDIGDIIPKNKKPKSNRKAMLSIKRRALPLVPAYCITTHKSQGQTLNKVVIDLKLLNDTDDIAAVTLSFCIKLMKRDIIMIDEEDSRMSLTIKTMDDSDWCIVLEEVNKKETLWQALGLTWDRSSDNIQEVVEPRFIELVKAIGTHPKLLKFGFYMQPMACDNKVGILLEALKDNHSIQDLSTISPDLDLETAHAFAQVLMNNKILLSLDISTSYCGPPDERPTQHEPMKLECGIELARALRTTNLQRLGIQQIDNKVLEVILQSLPNTLVHLDLSDNNINENSIPIIRSYLETNGKTLNELILDDDLANQYLQSQESSSLSTVKIILNTSWAAQLYRYTKYTHAWMYEAEQIDWSLLITELSKPDTTLRHLNWCFEEDTNIILQSLQLPKSEIGDIGIQVLLNSLPKTLSKLEVEYNLITAKSLPFLLAFLKTHPTLKQISLLENGISSHSSMEVNVPDLMETIFEASNENHCICYLNINESPINDVSNAESGELYLWYLRDDHILELFHELKKFPDRNWSIRFAIGTRLTSIGYRRLRDILSSTISVVEFEIGANNMNEEAQVNFLGGLCNNKTLQKCNLSQSKLNPDALDYIGRFIQNNLTLTKLTLDSCEISDGGIVRLAKYLSESSLKELSLGSNSLGDRDCTSLLSSIPSTLTDLSISNNRITTSSLQTILTFLAINRTLKRLEISQNPIFIEDYWNLSNDAVWQQIVEASKQNGVCEIA